MNTWVERVTDPSHPLHAILDYALNLLIATSGVLVVMLGISLFA